MTPEEKKTLSDLKEVVNKQSKAIRGMVVAIAENKKKLFQTNISLLKTRNELNALKHKPNGNPFSGLGL